MRRRLEFEANRIEAVLGSHGISGRVTGGTMTPRGIRFQVLPAMSVDVSKIKGLSQELASALNVAECQVLRCGAAVTVEVPRNDPQPIRLALLYRQLQNERTSIPPMTAILGLGEDGAPLLIRLPSPSVGNILVVGGEGAGKTSLLRTISLSLEWANSGVDLHNVHIIDDLEMFDQTRQDGIMILARRADEYVIVATSDISLARRIRDVFPVRIVGRVASAEEAYGVTGCSGARAEQLMGQGDFLAVAEGEVIRFQAAFIDPGERDGGQG